VHPDSQFWKQITESQFPWEREALAFIRAHLPDADPVRAWSNFEFVDGGGQVHEVDLLVLTRRGFFLVEIKSWQGLIEGNTLIWTKAGPNGTRESVDNPLLLANRKAKKLISLLRAQKSLRSERSTPFLEPLVFISDPDVQLRLPDVLRSNVLTRDRFDPNDTRADGQERIIRPGIIHALTATTAEEASDASRPLVDSRMARFVARALEELGVREPKRERRAGDYRLGERLFEGHHCQDWLGTHISMPATYRRVRIYAVPSRSKNKKLAETIQRAAQREFRILEGISHPSILRALDYRESDLGPALFFDHYPNALSLEEVVRDGAQSIDFDTRMHLVRRIAEALQYAHQKRLVHRALTPRCILIPHARESSATRLRDVILFNWQSAAREVATATSHAVTMTMHLSDLVDETTRVYVAPEALQASTANDDALGEEQDLFSLGAIAYFVFAGQPPATSVVELTQRLSGTRGLEIATVVDGVKESLRDLIRNATNPDAASRFGSVREFLDQLTKVEDEYTRPDDQFDGDPTEANAEDTLEGGIKVIKRLGQGSSAVVFLINKGGVEQVLKLASDVTKNDLIRAEHDVLSKLRHSAIVEARGIVEINDHVGLLLASAGETTLGQRLRSDGPLTVDLLQRFGDDLLNALVHLEQAGIAHRDLKPDNIGVVPVGRSNLQHAVLFDFSLSRTPPENIRAGTGPYIDPFLALRKPARWDLHAERWSAAVTLYEMTTATPPKFGDGRTDPALLDVEATLETDLFPAQIRPQLRDFFQQALRRDPAKRFDNAELMLRAWRKVFATVDAPAVPSDDGRGVDFAASVAEAQLDSPLELLGLSNRAVNALERVSVATVRDLLRLPIPQISHMRGVGNKTRRELLELLKLLAAKFPADQREALSSAPPSGGDDVAEAETPETLDSASLLRRLLPSKRSDRDATRIAVIDRLLGLDPSATGGWPSQSDIAPAVGVTRERVRQILAEAAKKWIKLAPLSTLREEIARLIQEHGGVATVDELGRALLNGTAERDDPAAPRRFAALLRAAVETERAADSDKIPRRFALHRVGDRAFVALTQRADGATAAADSDDLLARLTAWAVRLGKKADELAIADPLAAPSTVLQSLQSFAPPTGAPVLSPSRLVRLAAAASSHAAVSSRLELYPKGMPAERALKLAHAALLNQESITVAQLRERIAARYPDAAPLPDRPALDELLKATGRDFKFDDGKVAYVARDLRTTQLTVGLPTSSRQTTAPDAVAGPLVDVDPETADANEVERRLARARHDGGFLALSVAPKHYLAARGELAARFALEPMSFDALLLARMKQIAREKNVKWDLVLYTDSTGPDTHAWRNLLELVRLATSQLLDEWTSTDRPLLVTDLGLLQRYDQLERLAALRERAGRRPRPGERPLHGLWLLVAQRQSERRPEIDGAVVPVISGSEWVPLTSAWVKNRHRSVGARARVGEPGSPRL